MRRARFLAISLAAVTAACSDQAQFVQPDAIGSARLDVTWTCTGTCYYVDGTNGNNANAGTSPQAAKQTIASAINAATAPATIVVAQGTYSESPTIEKALTIVGPNKGKKGTDTRSTEAEITGTLTINSSNVTVDGFTFSSSSTSAKAIVYGSSVQTGTNITIQNNRFSGYANHIHFNNSWIKANPAKQISILDNYFGVINGGSSFTAHEIQLLNSDEVLIKGNSFDQTGTTATNPKGIRIESVRDVVVEDNTIDLGRSSFTESPPVNGIEIAMGNRTTERVTIRNNLISGAINGIATGSNLDLTTVTVSGNTIDRVRIGVTFNAFTGIPANTVSTLRDLTIKNNKITATEYAIGFRDIGRSDPSIAITFDDIEVTENWIAPYGETPSPTYRALFVAEETRIVNGSAVNGSVVATNNYWNSATGPATEPLRVVYSPFISTFTAGSNTRGFFPTAFSSTKKATSIELTCSGATYDGSVKEPCVATVMFNGNPLTGASASISYASNTNAGTASASATYAGNSEYAEATANASFTIAKAASTTTVTCTAGPFTYTGSGITPCSVTVTGAGGLSLTPATVYANNVNAGTASASFTYEASTNHLGSSDSKDFFIAKASASININNLTDLVALVGQTFTPTYAYVGDGTKSFSASGACSASSGVVSFNAPGNCVLTASATAGTNYNAVTGDPQTVSVSVGGTMSNFFGPITAGTNTVTAGQAIPIKFTLTPNPAAATFLAQSKLCTGTTWTTEPSIAGTDWKLQPDGTWQNNWKTPKEYAGSCRDLRVTPTAAGYVISGKTATFSFR